VVDGGDHSFKVRQAARQAAVDDEIQRAIADWLLGNR
jgi:hypothetical protein